MRSLPREAGTLRVGLALIIGGAAGNLVDRIGQGQVLDFLMTPLRPGIFNLADVLIYLGLGLAVLGVWLWERPTTAGAMSGATAIPTGPDPPDPPAGP